MKTDQLPYTHKPGTWYLAMMWQNPHFLRAFLGCNFSLFHNPWPRPGFRRQGKTTHSGDLIIT